MSKLPKLYIFFFAAIMVVNTVFAQNAVNSVYSRFGLGLDTDPGTGPQAGMGNAGSALRSPILINPVNPASLSALSITTFQTGLQGERINQRTASDTASSWRGGFGFLHLGFRCNKGWAAAAGLQPLNSMGYTAQTYTEDEGQLIRNYQSGSGGLNKAFVMQAISPLKWFKDSLTTDIAIGASADFLFGNYERFRFMSFEGSDTSNFLGQRVAEEINNKSVSYTAGIQLSQEFGRKTEDELRPYVLVLGLAYRPDHRLPLNYSSTTSVYRLLGSTTQVLDTVSTIKDQRFYGELSGEWRGGISLSYKHHLLFSYDYTLSDRSGTVTPWGAGEMGKRLFHRGGIQYYPAKKTDRNYFRHTFYRLGFRFGQTGIIANGQMLREEALNAGVGLKLGKKTFSTLNLSFEAGRRGNLKSDLLSENWYQLGVGIVLNDANWFMKRKFD
ncbi:MAG: hypothetical protein RLZZ46_64 [Bacteroidota bacterium]|jgi:hypothetical protein